LLCGKQKDRLGRVAEPQSTQTIPIVLQTRTSEQRGGVKMTRLLCCRTAPLPSSALRFLSRSFNDNNNERMETPLLDAYLHDGGWWLFFFVGCFCSSAREFCVAIAVSEEAPSQTHADAKGAKPIFSRKNPFSPKEQLER